MHIIQLADLHLTDKQAPPVPLKILKDEIVAVITKCDLKETVICICGDIIFKGDVGGYETARRFFQELLNESGLPRNQVLVCPGNHDLLRSRNDFSGFNEFVFALTRNEGMIANVERTLSVVNVGDIACVLINSSSHLDHTYGAVDVRKLQKEMSSISAENIIICLHHHLIPNEEYSCVKNSYDFIRLCEDDRVKLVLHGHRHMASLMAFGESKFVVCGAGSIGLDLKTTGYTNQFNRFLAVLSG